MNWQDVGKAIQQGVPLLAKVVSNPIGSVAELAGNLIARALGVDNNPDQVMTALKNNPDAIVRLREIELNHSLELEKMLLEAETAQLTQVNRTFRTEVNSDDPYVRRWRPTLGYCVSFTWVLMFVMMGIAVLYTVVFNPSATAEVMANMAKLMVDLSIMWPVAFAVLGVAVSARSKDKQLMMGKSPTGLMDKVTGWVKK